MTEARVIGIAYTAMNTAQNFIVAAGSIAALPFYRCHKEVQACQILRIDEIDLKYWIVPCSTKLHPFGGQAAYIAKHSPQPGGYYVRYADGYESFSPAEPFEDGYTLLVQEPTADPMPTTAGTWNEERDLENMRAECLRMAVGCGFNRTATGLIDSAKQFMDFIRPPAAEVVLPRKPTIAELEAILGDPRTLRVEVHPNGEVHATPVEETGWVIEKGDPAAPEYFMFHQGVSALGEAFGWSEPGDHSKALRFARQDDAAVIAPVLFAGDSSAVRVCEHAWS